ncbi:MAG: hypothetical protein M1334_00430 [Patescibacteria group bacterium]|nr:hypothetical protein [Patescibacteria group bacterium]
MVVKIVLIVLIVLVGIPLWALIGRFVWWFAHKFNFVSDYDEYIISKKTLIKLLWPLAIVLGLLTVVVVIGCMWILALVVVIGCMWILVLKWCWKGREMEQ